MNFNVDFMGMWKDKLWEKYAVKKKDELTGEKYEDFPEDFGLCYYCGYTGLEWKQKVCPKCHKLDILYGKMLEGKGKLSEEAVIKARDKWNKRNTDSQISEMWVATYYRNKGYKVKRTSFFDLEQEKTIYDKEGVDKFIKENGEDFELMKLLAEFKSGHSDLILFKDGKYSFVEVKSNSSSVKPQQHSFLTAMKEKGYEALVHSVDTSFNVENSKEHNLEDLEFNKAGQSEFYYKPKK